MSAPSKAPRRTACIVGIALVVVAIGFLSQYRTWGSRIVTKLALRDATRMVEESADLREGKGRAARYAIQTLIDDYGPYFRHELLDVWQIAGQLPRDRVTPEIFAPLLVASAYYAANEKRYRVPDWRERMELTLRELERWLDPAARLPDPKELLINLLTTRWEVGETEREREAGPPKSVLASILFLPCDRASWLEGVLSFEGQLVELKPRVLDRVRDEHWDAIERDCDHPREKVRAGAILLLGLHPSEEVFVQRALAALEDPSDWVRLVAAGRLALKGRAEGFSVLIQHVGHERWEVRFWCAVGLTAIGYPGTRRLLETRRLVEEDSWLRRVLADIQLTLPVESSPVAPPNPRPPRSGGLRRALDRLRGRGGE